MKRWVCKDWYFDIEQSHVRGYDNQPSRCFFKAINNRSDAGEHTARCGWYNVTMDYIPTQGEETPDE